MIRTIVECQQCKEQKDINGLSLRRVEAPIGWFHVYQGDPAGQDALHFCSRGCLIQWAQHPAVDWPTLSPGQQKAVDTLRAHISAHAIAEIELFYKYHPDLRVIWNFLLDPILRGKQFDNSCAEAERPRERA